MITKKKRIYFGLLLSMLGVSAVQAYTIKVKNSTPYKAKIEVSYKASSAFSCRPDQKDDLMPGHTAQYSSGICTVEKVTASLYDTKVNKWFRAEQYYAELGVMGNQTFIITGPFENDEYSVTRKVN